MRTLVSLLALAACAAPGTPSHLPHPLAMPGAVIGHAISEVHYRARRAALSDFVRSHHAALLSELPQVGPAMTRAMGLARVPLSQRPTLLARLSDSRALYADPEALVVALMVHGA